MKSWRMMSRTICWVVVSVLLRRALCQTAVIIDSPKSANIAKNSNALVTCTAICSFINWEVNGQPLNNEFRDQGFHEMPTIDLNVTKNFRKESLQVLGSPHSNNVSIVCVAVLQLPNETFVGVLSEPALVLVQGLLESVSNLTVIPVNSISVLISWSPPFTLEGVPILGYNVTITITISGKNETMLVEDTTLLYSIDHSDPENNFTVTVTVVPINEVGAGQPATLQFLSFPTNTSVNIKISPASMLYTSTAASTVLSSYVNATGVAPPTGPSRPGPGYMRIVVIAVPVLIISAVIVGFTIGVCVFVFVRQKKRKSEYSVHAAQIRANNLQGLDTGQGTAGDHEMRPRPVANDGDEDAASISSEDQLIEPDGEDSLTALPTIPNANKTRILSAICVPRNRAAVVRHLPAVHEADDSIGDTYFFLPKGCPTQVHLLPDSQLPPKFLSVAAENAATDEIALHVLTPVKESRSDFDLQNLLQTGNESKRRHSALFLSKPKLLTSEKKPLLDEKGHQNAEDDLSDDEQNQKGKNKKLDADIVAQNTSSTLESDHIQPWESRYVELPFVRPKKRLSTDSATISSGSQDQHDNSVGEQGKKSEVPTSEFRETIAKRLKHKWRQIGIYLKIDHTELDQIAHECNGDDSHCSSELFRKWAAQEVSTSSPFTWKGLIETLDNDAVKESSLSRRLKSKQL